ncbi:DUF2920 family protein, partial [Campylobacter jejuni]|nr:DUF2920 family protein [Campylobacter jejuni]
MIRSLLNSSHLTIQASVNKNIILVSYHSLKIHLIQQKI